MRFRANFYPYYDFFKVYSKDDDRVHSPYKFIVQIIHDLLPTRMQVVTGEGGMLVNNNFLHVCDKIGLNGGRMEIIVHLKNGMSSDNNTVKFSGEMLNTALIKIAEELNLSLTEDVEECIEKVGDDIKKNYLAIYLAPGRPKWHFTILDDSHIMLQEKHEHGDKKKHIFIAHNDKIIRYYSELFDEWKKECKRVVLEEV